MAARNWVLAVIVAAGLTLPSSVCFAEPKIGNAVTINNEVEAVTAEGAQPLTTGSELYSNELVRTGGGESMAQLLFLDNTNLSVGPGSTIRLDKFVYDPNGRSGSMILVAGRGAFRFITGLQDSKSYTIKTAYAAIGVRGTEFYVLVKDNEVQIQLIKGHVIVRTISQKVVLLEKPNVVLTVDSKGNISQLEIVNHPIVDLANLGPPVTNYASLFPPATNVATGGDAYYVAGGLAALGGFITLELVEHHKPASP